MWASKWTDVLQIVWLEARREEEGTVPSTTHIATFGFGPTLELALWWLLLEHLPRCRVWHCFALYCFLLMCLWKCQEMEEVYFCQSVSSAGSRKIFSPISWLALKFSFINGGIRFLLLSPSLLLCLNILPPDIMNVIKRVYYFSS